jgi:hypothetical protein
VENDEGRRKGRKCRKNEFSKIINSEVGNIREGGKEVTKLKERMKPSVK